MADPFLAFEAHVEALVKAVRSGDAERVATARKALLSAYVERPGNSAGNPDHPGSGRVMDPHHVDGSQSVAGVKTFVKGQRVRLTVYGRYPREVADRLGEFGTVAWATSHPGADVQVDLDVGGLWWVRFDEIAAVEDDS